MPFGRSGDTQLFELCHCECLKKLDRLQLDSYTEAYGAFLRGPSLAIQFLRFFELKMHFKFFLSLLTVFAFLLPNVCSLSHGQEKPDTAAANKTAESKAERDARLAWWREARFGMFVHWGVYSVVGGQYKGQDLPNSAEWMMARGEIPIVEYQKYAEQFNPVKFDADVFVARAKRAGMKYIVITAKNYDGFAMFGSTASDYNVVDKTPFGRDIMKELADACAKQGIKFGFYYSQAQDWHHPGGFGNDWDKTIKRVSSDQYVTDKAVPEVKQLMTDYGDVGIFWWDTPRKMSEESFDALHSLTKLQKNTITNDRLGEDYPGDYKTFERTIPAKAPPGIDWEVCMPISGSWGYKIGDDKFKSTSKLIRNLVTISSMGGNYLLNVSPTGEGTLRPPAIERLEAIGDWMDVNSESIYGTSASPIGDFEWGKCTRKVLDGKTRLYLQVFDWPADGKLFVPWLKNPIESASLLDGGAKLETEASELGATISLPAEPSNPYSSVVVVDVDGEMEVAAKVPTFDKEGKMLLTVDEASIDNSEGRGRASVRKFDGVQFIGNWGDQKTSVEWLFRCKSAGTYQVFGEMAVEKDKTQFRVQVVDQGEGLLAQVKSTGSYEMFKEKLLGAIRIEKAGENILRIVPDGSQWKPMNLRWIKLREIQ